MNSWKAVLYICDVHFKQMHINEIIRAQLIYVQMLKEEFYEVDFF